MKGTWLLDEHFTPVQKIQIRHEFVAGSNMISHFFGSFLSLGSP